MGPFKVSVSGSVSAHSSNTRSSDNSAKYHVDVSATNHGTPEGLARVLDMMAANVAPQLVGSRAVDESGKELDSAKKQKNQQIRALREKKFQNESAVRAASEVYDKKMKDLLDKGSSIENSERLELAKPGDANAEMTEEQKQAIESKRNEIGNNWDSFRASVKAIVASACDNSRGENGELDEAKLGKLEERVVIMMCAPYQETGDPALAAIELNYVEAVKACNDLKNATKAMEDNNVEYNRVMMS